MRFVGVAIILAVEVWVERVDLLLHCRLCCVFLSKVEVFIGPNAKQQGASELIHSENLLVGMHKVYYLVLQVVSFGFDAWTFMCA